MRWGRALADAACRALAGAGLAVLLLLALFTMLDGTLRALISRPIDLVREVGDLVAAFGVACCLPISLLRRSNITLRALAGVRSARVVRAVEVLAAGLVLVVLLGMAWQFLAFALKTARAGDVTWLMNLPKAPFWFAVDAVLWVAVLVQVAVLAEAVAGEAPPPDLEGAA